MHDIHVWCIVRSGDDCGLLMNKDGKQKKKNEKQLWRCKKIKLVARTDFDDWL